MRYTQQKSRANVGGWDARLDWWPSFDQSQSHNSGALSLRLLESDGSGTSGNDLYIHQWNSFNK